MEAPYPDEAIKFAEKHLSASLFQKCKISINLELNDDLIKIIKKIDFEKFRSELQYTIEELSERSEKLGFILFMLTCDNVPTAFVYGYNDKEKSTFFIDTLATIVEGKGIGSILITLALVYAIDTGYNKATLYTEEIDEKGRKLVAFYQDLGFTSIYKTPDDGVLMIQWLDPSNIWRLCRKFLEYNMDEEKNISYRFEDL